MTDQQDVKEGSSVLIFKQIKVIQQIIHGQHSEIDPGAFSISKEKYT